MKWPAIKKSPTEAEIRRKNQIRVSTKHPWTWRESLWLVFFGAAVSTGWHSITRPFVFEIRVGSPAQSETLNRGAIPFMPHEWDKELALLAKADPDGAHYLVQHNVSVFLLKERDLQNIRQNSKDVAWGFTPDDDNVILLNSDLLPSPELRASTISHELIHVEHGRGQSLSGHSHFRHVFLCEEAEAHWQEFQSATLLGAPYLVPVWANLLYIFLVPVANLGFLTTLLIIAFRHRDRLGFPVKH